MIDPFKKEIGNAIVLSSGPKKQNTRLLKVQCPGCGYTMRITQKWIDQGTPTCVCGEETQVQKI